MFAIMLYLAVTACCIPRSILDGRAPRIVTRPGIAWKRGVIPVSAPRDEPALTAVDISTALLKSLQLTLPGIVPMSADAARVFLCCRHASVVDGRMQLHGVE
jgi:hypothetical protein